MSSTSKTKRTIVLITLSFVFIPVVFFGAYQIHSRSKLMERQALNSIMGKISKRTEKMENIFKKAESYVKQISMSRTFKEAMDGHKSRRKGKIRHWRSRLAEHFMSFCQMNNVYKDIRLVTSDGKEFVATDASGKIKETNHLKYTSGIQRDTFGTLSGTFGKKKSISLKKSKFVLSIPVLNSGVVIISLSKKYLLQDLDYLFDDSGKILLKVPDRVLEAPTAQKNLQGIKSEAFSSDCGIINTNGKLLAFSHIKSFPNWIVSQVHDKKLVFAKVSEFRRLAIPVFIFGTILFFTLTALISAKLIKPIAKATDYDSLTGAFNRSIFQQKLKNEISKKRMFSLCMLDIDDFKKLNDTYGHQTGDFILKKLTEHFLKHLRKKDIFARYGGEEFVVFLPNMKTDQAYEFIDNIRKTFSQEVFVFGESKIQVSFSAGLTGNYPGKNGATESELLESADKSLYLAKNQGKNRTVKTRDTS